MSYFATFDYNKFMLWLRNGFVYILSLIFFLCLLFGASSASINVALAHPEKLESWISQSGLYDSVVNTAIKQAQTSTSNNNSSGISLSDPAVQQAAKDAFTTDLLKTSVNTVLNSNYSWLEGKTDKPDFKIDLTTAKQTFAQQVGNHVSTYLSGLPVCTPAQAASLKNYDPLSVYCRPASLNPATEGANVTNQILTGSGFLSNPVLTADNLNPKNTGTNASAQVYYLKFSYAPKAYQAATKLPWAIAALGSLCALGVIFISAKKRKGLHRVGVTLTFAGVILITSRFAADYALKHVETQVFNNSSVGDLQRSLTSFAQLVESQIVKIDMYFGIAYLVLAALIFIGLMIFQSAKNKSKPKPTQPELPKTTTETTPLTPTNPPVQQISSTPRIQAQGAPELKPKPPVKRPKLIQ